MNLFGWVTPVMWAICNALGYALCGAALLALVAALGIGLWRGAEYTLDYAARSDENR